LRWSQFSKTGKTCAEHSRTVSPTDLASTEIARQLAECGNLFHRWQWSLATSSNYSALLESGAVVISRSGVDKQFMTSADFMIVDIDGKPTTEFDKIRPSAETELHCHLYRHARLAELSIAAVLHTHSKFAVHFSRRFATEGVIRFQGFEMQKSSMASVHMKVQSRFRFLPIARLWPTLRANSTFI
jgi:methylthioribulose-1-phosphate dehydratase